MPLPGPVCQDAHRGRRAVIAARRVIHIHLCAQHIRHRDRGRNLGSGRVRLDIASMIHAPQAELVAVPCLADIPHRLNVLRNRLRHRVIRPGPAIQALLQLIIVNAGQVIAASPGQHKGGAGLGWGDRLHRRFGRGLINHQLPRPTGHPIASHIIRAGIDSCMQALKLPGRVKNNGPAI